MQKLVLYISFSDLVDEKELNLFFTLIKTPKFVFYMLHICNHFYYSRYISINLIFNFNTLFSWTMFHLLTIFMFITGEHVDNRLQQTSLSNLTPRALQQATEKLGVSLAAQNRLCMSFTSFFFV